MINQRMHHRLAARGGRRGLASLEFCIALPFVMLMFALVVTMFEVCLDKLYVSITARNDTWKLRHDATAANATETYPSPVFEDPFFGGVLTTIAKIDDEVRWFQISKIHWLKNAIPPIDTTWPPNKKAHAGVQMRKSVINHPMPAYTLMSNLAIETKHYVLSAPWDYRDLEFKSFPSRFPMVPHFKVFVFIVPSFEQQGYTKYGYGVANALQNVLNGAISDIIGQLTDLGSSTGVGTPSTPTDDSIANSAGLTQQIQATKDKIAEGEDLRARANRSYPSLEDHITDPIGSFALDADITWAKGEYNLVYGGDSALADHKETLAELEANKNNTPKPTPFNPSNPPTAPTVDTPSFECPF